MKLLQLMTLALLSTIAPTYTQWAPVTNGATAPVIGMQMSQLSVGNAQNIWSSWQHPFEQHSEVAQWNNTTNKWVANEELKDLPSIIDISATTERNTVLLLSSHDDASLQAMIEAQPGADEALKAQGTIDALKNNSLLLPQQLLVWNGTQLIPTNISNSVATSIDAFSKNNIAINSVSPGLNGSLNATSPANSAFNYLNSTNAVISVQAGSNGFYYLEYLPDQTGLQIRSSDTVYYTLPNISPEAVLYWNISNKSIWIVLDEAGTVSINKIDKTTKNETTLPAVPGEISRNNAAKILFSTGYDDTAWALSNDGTMYRFQ